MSSRTLAEAFQYASQFIRLAPLSFTAPPSLPTGGRSGDPALSIGDWVRQTILSPPFSWRWNRGISSSISTVIGTQDYTVTSASGAVMTGPTTVSITSNLLSISSAAFGATSTFGATVTFSSFTTPALTFLNGTTGIVLSSSATALTVMYQHGNLAPTAAGGIGTITAYSLPSFGWLEKASLTNTGITKEIPVKLVLGEESTTNLPAHISPLIETGSSVTFRLIPAPDKVYDLRLTYQIAAPSFAATTDTWAPIPDYMFHLISLGVQAKAYEYLGDERWPITLQSFLKQLISFHGGLTESQINLFMGERLITQSSLQGSSAKTQQSILARGLQ